MHDECVNIDGREYGTVHRKHDGNSVCQLALIAPVTVNIFGSFSPHAPGNIHFLNLLMDPPSPSAYMPKVMSTPSTFCDTQASLFSQLDFISGVSSPQTSCPTPPPPSPSVDFIARVS